MTATVAQPRSARSPVNGTFTGLARRELRRFVVNPVFLLGAVLSLFQAALVGSEIVTDINAVSPYAAILVGGFSMMAAFWQTRSLRPSSQVVDTTPVPLPLRSAALCTVAVVPLLCGVASLLLFQHSLVVAGDWVYGAFDPPTRTAVLVSQFVLPSLGGALLGVALGRWVHFGHFPGAAFVLFLLLYGWVNLTTVLSLTRSPDETPVVVLRFLAPFAFFTFNDDTGGVTTWRGSPWFFLGWQLALCAIAVLLAVLHGAEGRTRRRILRGLWFTLAVAVVLLGLTVTGGLAHAVTTAS